VTRTFLLLSFSILFLLSAGGCFKLGPDFVKPEVDIQAPENYMTLLPEENPITIPEDRWWTIFGNPEIDQLVDTVFANNPDIRMAAAQILEVQSRFQQTRASRYPYVSVQGGWQEQHQTITNPLTGGGEALTTDTWALSIPAVFEYDLWGRLARADEAAQADLLAAEENQRIIAQSLVAEAIGLYLQIEALERRIQVNQKSLETYRRSLDFVDGRYQRGLAPMLDVRQARRRLAQAEAALPSLIQDLGTTQQRLAVLQGEYPKTRTPREHDKDYFKYLAPVPPGLPSDLLKRRPDIQAAEARLHALTALIGVAKASRFPAISLTGSFGYASTDLDGLFTPEAELWSIAAGLTQPLFDAGRLAAGQRGAEARYAQGLAQYAKTVLSAFSEVEGALLTRKQQLEKRELVLVYLEEARATQEQAQQRYIRGLTSYIVVLEAQLARFLAEESLILVDLAIFSNRVRLHRALGGGWADKELAAVDKEKTEE
jgi:multidrug efflux system outer membrane protein